MNHLYILSIAIGSGILITIGYVCGKIEETIRQEKKIKESYMDGYQTGKEEKRQAYIDLGNSETILRMLIDDIKNNVFSAEIREN